MFSCASLPMPSGRLGERLYCGKPTPPVDSGSWKSTIRSPTVHIWSGMDCAPNEIA